MALESWWLWFSRLTGPWCYRCYQQQADGQPGLHRDLELGIELCTTKTYVKIIWVLHTQYLFLVGGVQSLNHVWVFVSPGTASHQACLSFSISQSLFQFMSIELVMPSIQPSHPLSSPSPPAFSLSQHQGLFQWVGSSYQLAKVLEFQLHHQPFQWIFLPKAWSPLGLTGLISLQSKGLSRVFCCTTIWQHQFFSTQPYLQSNCHIHTSLLVKP